MNLLKRINITLLALSLLAVIQSCKEKDELAQNTVFKGEFIASQKETGELIAVNSVGITIPFIGWKYGRRYKITQIANHGDNVSEGDIVARIDPSSVIRVLEEEQSKLEFEQANLKKTKANHESQLSQLNSELAREEANFNLIQLQVDKFKFEPERKQKIKALELEIAEIKNARVKKKIELKKIIIENELNIQRTRIKQIQSNIKAAEIALSKLDLYSPITGIVQLEENWRTDKMVQLGDELGQGWPVVSVPDMSAMKVAATINESDIYKIKIGQKVKVRLDAYPAKSFSGEIAYIGKLSRNKERDNPIKVFDFEVAIIDKDPALKPGMTVSCEVILAEFKNTLYVKNDCVFQENSGYYLLPENGKTQNKIPIEIIGRNNDFTAINGEVKKGQKLISRTEYSSLN